MVLSAYFFPAMLALCLGTSVTKSPRAPHICERTLPMSTILRWLNLNFFEGVSSTLTCCAPCVLLCNVCRSFVGFLIRTTAVCWANSPRSPTRENVSVKDLHPSFRADAFVFEHDWYQYRSISLPLRRISQPSGLTKGWKEEELRGC